MWKWWWKTSSSENDDKEYEIIEEDLELGITNITFNDGSNKSFLISLGLIEYFADLSEKTDPDIYSSTSQDIPFEKTPGEFQKIMKKEFEMST